jgi:hypothetical protein
VRASAYIAHPLTWRLEARPKGWLIATQVGGLGFSLIDLWQRFLVGLLRTQQTTSMTSMRHFTSSPHTPAPATLPGNASSRPSSPRPSDLKNSMIADRQWHTLDACGRVDRSHHKQSIGALQVLSVLCQRVCQVCYSVRCDCGRGLVVYYSACEYNMFDLTLELVLRVSTLRYRLGSNGIPLL